MRVRKFEKPLTKMAVAMNKGDIIRYEMAGAEGYKMEAVFLGCNVANNGVTTEIHIMHKNGDKEKIYDTDRIEKVIFEVIGVVEKWD